MRTLHVDVLTAKTFEAYGRVLDAADATPRLNFCSDFTNPRPEARLNLALIQAPVRDLPIHYDTLERHPFSEQIFFSVGNTNYLAIVACSNSQMRPDLETLKAFIVPAGLGIAYFTSTWHTGMVALEAPGHFAMLIHEAISDDDCHYVAVPEFEVRLAPKSRSPSSEG